MGYFELICFTVVAILFAGVCGALHIPSLAIAFSIIAILIVCVTLLKYMSHGSGGDF